MGGGWTIFVGLTPRHWRDGPSEVIERLWRSIKYECVCLNAFETGSEARAGIGRWIDYCNTDRPHSAFGGRTPAEVHQGLPARTRVAV